jgi:hypothetical protein
MAIPGIFKTADQLFFSDDVILSIIFRSNDIILLDSVALFSEYIRPEQTPKVSLELPRPRFGQKYHYSARVSPNFSIYISKIVDSAPV